MKTEVSANFNNKKFACIAPTAEKNAPFILIHLIICSRLWSAASDLRFRFFSKSVSDVQFIIFFWNNVSRLLRQSQTLLRRSRGSKSLRPLNDGIRPQRLIKLTEQKKFKSESRNDPFEGFLRLLTEYAPWVGLTNFMIRRRQTATTRLLCTLLRNKSEWIPWCC